MSDMMRPLAGMRQGPCLVRPKVCHRLIAVKAEVTRQQVPLDRARAYYQEVWSGGRVLKLNTIMAEDHRQHDMVWQPTRVGLGRRAMKRGILAYRKAYPDLTFTIQDLSYSAEGHSVFVAWMAKGTNLGPIREQQPTRKVTEFSGITKLEFDEHHQIKASYVFRQAPADEARYFLSSLSFGQHQA